MIEKGRVKELGSRVKEEPRKMKDSGVEWIGEIPEGWRVAQLKRFSIVCNGKEIEREVSNSNKDAINVYGSGGVFKYTDDYLYDGESVLFGRKGTIGKPIYVCERFWTVDTMYFMKFNKNIVPKFCYYYLSSYPWETITTKTALPSVVGTDVVNSLFAFPPLLTQEEITGFLDQKTAKIDHIIGKTKQSIEDYKKYKQSLITETVTKGLNPDAEMKDSGIEWIGEVPSHWERYRLRNLFRFSNGLTVTKSDLIEDGVSCINYGDIHSKYTFDLDLKTDELPKVDIKFKTDRPNTLLNNGDFVFCDTSEDLDGSGNFVFIRDTNGKDILAGSHTTIAKPQRKFNAAYMGYLLKSFGVKRQFEREVVGVKVYSITQGILKNIGVVLPPLDEQMAIADYLDHKRIQIDAIIDRKEQLIKELKVYEKSLIYECVTGKRDVGE